MHLIRMDHEKEHAEALVQREAERAVEQAKMPARMAAKRHRRDMRTNRKSAEISERVMGKMLIWAQHMHGSRDGLLDPDDDTRAREVTAALHECCIGCSRCWSSPTSLVGMGLQRRFAIRLLDRCRWCVVWHG